MRLLCRTEWPFVFDGNLVWHTRSPMSIDPAFLSGFFEAPAGGSSQYRRSSLRVVEITSRHGPRTDCEFHIPPLVEQRAIAHILGTLDDKIELNRRMNETLEAMARALFKSWFVDFDPVRAKQVGWVSPSGRNPPIAVNGGLRGDAATPP